MITEKEIDKNDSHQKMILPSIVPLTTFFPGHGYDNVGGVVVDVRVVINIVVGIGADAIQIVVVVIDVVVHVDH